MNIRVVLLSLGVLVGNYARCESIAETLGLTAKSGDKIFVGVVENRHKQLEKLHQEREKLVKRNASLIPELKSLADEAKAHITQANKQLEHKKGSDEFLKQKLILLNESYLVFKDVQRDSEKLVSILDDFTRLIKDFLDDPEFTTFKKEQKLRERLYYSFEDLKRLYNLILDQEKKVALLTDQEKQLAVELANRKRSADATLEAYKNKKGQLESGQLVQGYAIDTQQRKELISLEERLYNYKKILDSLRMKEIEYRIEFVSLQLSIAKSHLTIYRDYVRAIKPVVRVTEADIAHAREELAKLTNSYRITKEQYRSEIDRILVKKEATEASLQELAKANNVVINREVDEWSKEPAQTIDGYLNYCEIGLLHAQLMSYRRDHELLDAHIELEDEKIKEEALSLQVKESYHKKFSTEEEITQELKKFESAKSESTAGLTRYKEKINTIADLLSMQKRTLDNIAAIRKKIEKNRETIFRSNHAIYQRSLALLAQAEQLEKDQIDTLSKLTGVYSGLTAVMSNKLRLITFITGELSSRTIWHRPDYAITWEGVKNIVPDVVSFLSYIRTYALKSNIKVVFKQTFEDFKQPSVLALFILKMLAVLGILMLIGRYFLGSITVLPVVSEPSQGLKRILGMFVIAVANFINTYFVGIAVWMLLFAALRIIDFSDAYVDIVFYLLSIPYLMYLANRFMHYMFAFNQKHNYVFIASDFQSRFFIVASILFYSTIALSLFREAFMLAHFYRSELPTFLLAINFIIFQISLILLIDKEQILSLLPNNSDFWLWVHGLVNRFYYVMLLGVITIIVMSNPYVGFGRLVIYLFIGLLYSAIVLFLLYWMHQLFKRTAMRVFFTVPDDLGSQRFQGARTWFGISVIASFMMFSFFGFILAAKIWGWPVTFSRVMEIFEYPIIGGGTENPVTIITFTNIFLFVLVGFLVAYAIDKVVFERVFDILDVDPGVQHTITSIAQYVVIIAALFLGFQSAKLGALVNYIVGALILGLGLILKEPISDFISYFIILVQRPVKIGDYIQIDEEINGVVRKITARSVVLRKKNSMSLIIPNSFMLNRPVYNWNYTRNFIAVDDIEVCVDYAHDPEKVQEILYNVIASHPNILKNPKPWVRLDKFGEFGYQFMVRGFLSSVYTLEKWEIASAIRLRIARTFAEQNIKFALPTRLMLLNRDGLNMPPQFEKESRE